MGSHTELVRARAGLFVMMKGAPRKQRVGDLFREHASGNLCIESLPDRFQGRSIYAAAAQLVGLGVRQLRVMPGPDGANFHVSADIFHKSQVTRRVWVRLVRLLSVGCLAF